MAPAGDQKDRKRDGRRLRALEDAFHRTVKYALRPLDYEQFQDQFPVFDEVLVQDLYSGYRQASPAARPCTWCRLLASTRLQTPMFCRRCCTTRE